MRHGVATSARGEEKPPARCTARFGEAMIAAAGARGLGVGEYLDLRLRNPRR
ncbi:MAG: hypothetical protein M5U09_19405 [Gammaproteobacteria bacterium]|nr:hypothetical protein [Gammaproteobacteria bacterium]